MAVGGCAFDLQSPPSPNRTVPLRHVAPQAGWAGTGRSVAVAAGVARGVRACGAGVHPARVAGRVHRRLPVSLRRQPIRDLPAQVHWRAGAAPQPTTTTCVALVPPPIRRPLTTLPPCHTRRWPANNHHGMPALYCRIHMSPAGHPGALMVVDTVHALLWVCVCVGLWGRLAARNGAQEPYCVLDAGYSELVCLLGAGCIGGRGLGVPFRACRGHCFAPVPQLPKNRRCDAGGVPCHLVRRPRCR